MLDTGASRHQLVSRTRQELAQLTTLWGAVCILLWKHSCVAARTGKLSWKLPAYCPYLKAFFSEVVWPLVSIVFHSYIRTSAQESMQSLRLYTPNHPGLAVSCCLVDVLRELLRNRLESMILQLCHPCPRYTFQPITRDPTSFISCLEPASKLWSRCLGIYLDVSGGSDALPSVPWVWYVAIFHLRGACTQQMLCMTVKLQLCSCAMAQCTLVIISRLGFAWGSFRVKSMKCKCSISLLLRQILWPWLNC